MKSKKLISFLCAAAMTVSSFAGLTITASAANTPVWSNTFDGYNTGIFCESFAKGGGEKSNTTYIEGLSFYTPSRGDGDVGGYTDSADEYIRTGSYYAIQEKTTSDKYLRASYPNFGDFATNGRWGHIELANATTADATKDVVIDFKLKLTDGMVMGVTDTTTANKTNPVFRIGTFDTTAHTASAVAIDKSALSLGDDWVNVRIVSTNAAGSKVYINGEEKTAAAAPAVKSFKTIGLYSSDGNSTISPPYDVGNDSLDADKHSITPIADIDDFNIFTTAAGEATATSDAPTVDAPTSDATPAPISGPKVIPAAKELTPPSGVTGIQVYKFDDAATKKWIVQDNATDDSTTVPGINIHVGSRKGGASETYAAIKKIANGNNALELVSAKFGTAARAPRVSFENTLPIDTSAGNSTVLSLSVYLSEVDGSTGARPRLYFLKDAVTDGDGETGAYRNIAAVLTTSEEDVFYRESGNEESGKISAAVTPNEWHKVTFIVSGDKHRVYIDDDKDNASINSQYVSYGSNASQMSELPIIAVEHQAAKVSGNDTTPTYTDAYIDNVMAYQGDASNPKNLIPSEGEAPTPEPTAVPKHSVEITQDTTNYQKVTVTSTDETNGTFAGVLIHAKYDGKALTNVTTYDASGISKAGKTITIPAEDKVNEGDKLMVWNSLSGMIPYGTATAQGPKAISGTVEITGTPKVGAAITAAATLAGEATPKYQWQVADTADGTFANATGDGAATATYTPAAADAGKALRVVVTADGLDGEIVKAVDGTVAEKDKTALTGVTVAGTTTVGSELTATVAPAGATADIKWQRADATDGEYADINGATGATYTLVDADKDKYIKAVAVGTGDYSGTATSQATAQIAAAAVTYTITVTADAGVTDVKLTKGATEVTKDSSSAGTSYVFKVTETGEYTIVPTYAAEKVADSADASVTVAEGTATYTAAVTTKDKTYSASINNGVSDVKIALNDGAAGTTAITTAKKNDKIVVTSSDAEKVLKTVTYKLGSEAQSPVNATEGKVEITVTDDITITDATFDAATYTVNVPIEAGKIASVTLTDQTDATKKYTGTPADADATSVAVANVPAGTYKASAVAAEHYKDATISDAVITVSSSSEKTLADAFKANATAKVKSNITKTANANLTTYDVNKVDDADVLTDVEEGTVVTITVAAAEGYALAATPVAVTKANAAAVEVTAGAAGVYTFEMPAEAVTVTVSTIEQSNGAPAKIVVTPAKTTVSQGETINVTVTVLDGTDDNAKVTTQDEVTWTLTTPSNTDVTKVTAAGDAGARTYTLKIADNETPGTFTIKAASAVADHTDVESEAVTITVEEAVAAAETVVTLTKTDGTPIVGAVVTATDGNYLSANDVSGASVAMFAALTINKTDETDKDGKAHLVLNPNKEYTISATLNNVDLGIPANTKITSETTEAAATIQIAAVAEAKIDKGANADNIVLSPAAPIPGEEVTLTATGDNQYLTAVSIKDKAETPADVELTKTQAAAPNEDVIASAKFTMPADGITVTSTVSTLYAVTFADDDNETTGYTWTVKDGETPVTSGKLYAADKTLTVAVAANNAKKVATAAIDGDESTSILNNGTLTIKEATALTATVADKTYTITVADIAKIGETEVAQGTVTVDPAANKAAEEATVTLTVTPAEGYHVKNYEVVAADGDTPAVVEPAIKVTYTENDETKTIYARSASHNTTYTFSMPAGNVSVSAEFEEDQIRYEGLNGDAAASTTEFKANVNNYNKAGDFGSKFAGTVTTLVKVDAADLVTDDESISTKIKSALLTFHAVCTEKNSTITIIRITDDLGDTAFENLKIADLTDKAAVQVADLGSVDTSGKDLEADLTADLRAVGGSALYAIVTKTGREQTLTNLKFTLTEAQNDIPAAAITVQKVYADESGAITIDGSKYTAFGDAEQIAASKSYFVGDNYTPATTYKNAIDDTEGKTTRYEYVSGADATELAAATNTLYVIYNKIDYVATAFKVTLPEAAGEGGETVNVKLTGTPTSTGTPAAKAVDTNVAVMVAEGQTVGTASYKLLPGSYELSYPEDATYAGVEAKAVDVSDTEGTANAITLVKNAKTPTKITITYVDADTNAELKTAEITSNVYVGESYTIGSTYTEAFDTSDKGTPYKKYTYQADGSDSLTVSNPVASNNAVTLKYKSDGKDYYYEEDFEGETHTFTSVRGASYLHAEDDTATEKAHATKVLQVGFYGNGDVDASTKELNITDDVTVSFDFRMDPGGQKTKSDKVAILATTNSSNYLNTKNILEIVGTAGSSDSNGHWATMTINGTENIFAANSEKGWAAGVLSEVPNQRSTYSTHNKGYDSTGWLHLDATVHFATQKVDVVLTRIDGNATIYNGTVDFKDKTTDGKEAAEDGSNVVKAIKGIGCNVSKAIPSVSFDDIVIWKSAS